jgi:hypothetical protein
MAMKLHNMFVTAALSGALVFGGLSVAVAHHGEFDDHTTTKAKSRAEAERMERQITADLNKKALMVAQTGQNPVFAMGENPTLIGSGGQAEPMPAQPAAIPMGEPDEDNDVN